MKAFRTIILMALAGVAAGCLPAEEAIEDTGVSNFVANFETIKGAKALWGEESKLVVVDSKDESHKFAINYGAGKEDGEFAGIISPKSTVKYVIFSSDENSVKYNGELNAFSMDIPSNYNAKAAGALITENNAAVGILAGSQVELKSVCGFIKFTLETNGQVFEDEDGEHKLTELKKITIMSGDGKCFAGKLSAIWDAAALAPQLVSIEDGSSTISFTPRALPSESGEIFFEAGDYYLPVAPQTYEKVLITLEDSDGHKATLMERSIDVKRATGAPLGSLEWPCVVVSANFLCSSAAESKEHEVYSFSSENLSCDRVSHTTGQTVAGKSQKNTVVDFTHQGVGYQLFATNGYAKSANTSSCLLALMFNSYNGSWSYSSDTWTVGSPNGYAWIRIPEHEGVLTKIELTIISKDGTPFNISSEVDPVTGVGKADIVAPRATKAAQSTYETQTLNPINVKPGIAYYICIGNGHSYRIQAWKFYYKVFDN